MALGNPEHPCRVRGVSSSQGRKYSFPEDIRMYKKRKRSDAVDVDALTRDITQKVYSSIMGQLAAKGIEISMPQDFSPGVTGKSSCASREVEQQVVATETEPDTIDLLEGSTSCSLVIRPGGNHIEVARG